MLRKENKAIRPSGVGNVNWRPPICLRRWSSATWQWNGIIAADAPSWTLSRLLIRTWARPARHQSMWAWASMILLVAHIIQRQDRDPKDAVLYDCVHNFGSCPSIRSALESYDMSFGSTRAGAVRGVYAKQNFRSEDQTEFCLSIIHPSVYYCILSCE